MLDSYLFKILVAVFLSLIPVLIWMRFFIKSDKKDKRNLIKVFLIGIFSIVPILAIQYVWILKPEINLYLILRQSVSNIHLGFLFTFIAVGVFEEAAKFFTLINLKWLKIQINSVNDAMKYILIIALGYAFSENIIYFYTIIKTGQLGTLYTVVVLRSVFTTAAHMLFSGIAAYYYAIGKFGNPILELHKWIGKKHTILHFFQNLFKLEKHTLFKLYSTLLGLSFAMGMHAMFNFVLHIQRLDYAFIIVFFGFLWVMYLSRRRASFLVFSKEEEAVPSTIGSNEEDVIIELLGMWYNEGKYNEVIEICDRLSKRDPDNMVVKLFKEKAKDSKKMKRVKRAFQMLFSDKDYDVSEEEISMFERMKKEKLKDSSPK